MKLEKIRKDYQNGLLFEREAINLCKSVRDMSDEQARNFIEDLRAPTTLMKGAGLTSLLLVPSI